MIDKLTTELEKRLQIDAPPAPLTDLLTDILSPDNGPLRGAELAERYAPRVRARLATLHDEFHATIEDPWFEFNSSSPGEYIQGPCYAEPKDPPEIQDAKTRRIRAEPFRRALEALHFDQFETVCAALLFLLGARAYRRTAHARDQGIDFYGELVLGDLDSAKIPFFRFTDTLRVWLVGQAKHYPNRKVGTPEVRNLVGSINLSRFKEYASTTELLTQLPLRSCDPVFALFMTTGTYTVDAIRLAINSGVIAKNVNDLAKLLADRANVPAESDGSISPTALNNWAAGIVANAT